MFDFSAKWAVWVVLGGSCLAAPGPGEAKAGLAADLDPGPQGAPRRVLDIGLRFLGRPYLAGSLDPGAPAPDPQDEPLVCRTDAFDCVTFVETCLALERCQRPGSTATLAAELEQVRYRRGRRAGYLSRLHYFSDWIEDNAARGRLRELTASLGGLADPRPLHYMSRHREQYPALARPEVFLGIREAEARLSGTPRFLLPKAQVAAVLDRLQDGDVLGFTCNLDGLDVVHMGLACRGRDGAVHVLHASSRAGRVELSAPTLVDYLMASRRITGLRVARPA